MMLYGLPYMGSKARFAKDFVDALPSGRRFIDLFGGGAAMSHAAVLSGKYAEVIYSDVDPLVCEYVRQAVAGRFSSMQPRWISREEFHARRVIDPYVRYIWSFGNDGKSYIFGRNVEEKKRVIFERLIAGEIKDAPPTVRGLCRLSRAGAMEGLPIRVICRSYKNYCYEKGDVVYLDPPYAGMKSYVGTRWFDYAEFLNFAASIPCYISEYSINDRRFRLYYERETVTRMCVSSNSIRRTEKLYRSLYAPAERI